jgi:hypothetical protein
MQLPNKLPNDQRLRVALGKFYDAAKDKQWFQKAEIVEKHPSNMRNTLELYVNYNPVLEMKEILSFTHEYDLALLIIDLSNSDKART